MPVNITVCDIDGPNMHNLAAVAGIQSERQYFILSDNPMCSNLSAYNLTLEEQDKFNGQLSIKEDKFRVLAKEELGTWTDTFSAKACLVENNDICKIG